MVESMPVVPAHNDCGASQNAHDARPRIEVLTRSGARVRLFGEAAEQAIRAVMAEFAGGLPIGIQRLPSKRISWIFRYKFSLEDVTA